jgi:hypothetical protein
MRSTEHWRSRRRFVSLSAIATVLAALGAVDSAFAATGGNGAASQSRGAGFAISSAAPVEGLWQEFSFTSVGVDARGCDPADPGAPGCSPSSSGNSEFAGAPPWTFTAPVGGAALTVTDAFSIGDRFEVFDSATSLGETSAVPSSGSCGDDPVPCLASASHRIFILPSGPHSITITPTASPFGGGAAYFRVDPMRAGKVSARGTVGDTTFSAANNCTASASTRPFIVDWPGTRFTKTSVTQSVCFNDPSETPAPAVASGFDTQFGTAAGTLQDSSPATVEWVFIEGGAGSSPNDQVQIVVRNASDAAIKTLTIQTPGALGGTPGGVWTFAP